jgi:hypothetical protein
MDASERQYSGRCFYLSHLQQRGVCQSAPPLRWRGTQRYERNPNVRLTREQVKFIRDHFTPYDPVFGGSALGRKFGVSQAHISRIGHGASWEDV